MGDNFEGYNANMPFERMPQLPPAPNNEPKKESSLQEKTRAKADLMRRLQEAGRPVLGSGRESMVEVHPQDDTKVAAHRMEHRGQESTYMRKIFYSHRILHTLFPEHFPRIHAAFEHTDQDKGGTIRERVHVEKEGYGAIGRLVSPKSFRHVMQELRAIGIADITLGEERMGFDEGSSKNFGRGKDGYEKYLDTNFNINHDLLQKRNELLRYMQEHTYSEEDVQQVRNALDRLEALDKEAVSNNRSEKKAA